MMIAGEKPPSLTVRSWLRITGCKGKISSSIQLYNTVFRAKHPREGELSGGIAGMQFTKL